MYFGQNAKPLKPDLKKEAVKIKEDHSDNTEMIHTGSDSSLQASDEINGPSEEKL